jgi:hypothetical protein
MTTPIKPFQTPADALNFILGGNATTTFRSARTGDRYTFRVTASDDGKVHFVKVLTGADNESDYSFIGTIFPGNDGVAPVFRHSHKSKVGQGAPSVLAFRWAFNYLAEQAGREGAVLHQHLEVYHEGRCGRCNRKLTVPESIETGFGPECAGKVGA